MAIGYETDLAAWADEQAALLRRGDLSALDRLNLADEIDALARNERRELAQRVAALTAQLLCWQFQTGRHCEAWRKAIGLQRAAAVEVLEDSPSLHKLRDDQRWLRSVWLDAAASVTLVLGRPLPEELPWSIDKILDPDFWPD